MVVDLFLVYQFIRRLATPFNKWDAYKLGIIDENGKVLIKRKQFTRAEQRKAWGVYDIMIANLKKLLAKVPGGSSRIASYAAALFLIKEYKHFSDDSLLNEDLTDDQLDEALVLFNERYSYYTKLSEDVNQNLNEKLKKSDDMGTWIKDFYDSDAPQFKGKSKAKRRQMAVAAKLDAMDENVELAEAQKIRWKKSGNNGEIQATINGKKYQIEKALDHNERHKGEWKVMVWDKRRDSWEWETTEYGKANAKAWITDKLEETPANAVGSGNIAGMDGGHMSKAAQKKWTSGNKSKKKNFRDIIGELR